MYAYSVDGKRLSKTVNGVTTDFIYSGDTLAGFKRGSDTLMWLYGADGDYLGFTLNGAEYYYVKNMQGDIVAIADENRNIVVVYTYNDYGKLESTSGTLAETVGALNPIRYRGYYYDDETGFYYTDTRYYDPQTARFINADDESLIIATPMSLTDKNLYAYCDNNPISRADRDGQFWNVVIGAAVGAAANLVGQVVSDVVTSVVNRKVTISSWQTYVGAAVGGAVGGAILGGTGNVNLANAATGFFTTGVGMSLEKLTGASDKSWAEIGVNSAVDGLASYGLGKIKVKKPSKFKIVSGRNSMSAVYKSGLTKLRNNTAKHMSAKVVKKGLMSTFVGGLAMDGYYGIKQSGYDRVRRLALRR